MFCWRINVWRLQNIIVNGRVTRSKLTAKILKSQLMNIRVFIFFFFCSPEFATVKSQSEEKKSNWISKNWPFYFLISMCITNISLLSNFWRFIFFFSFSFTVPIRCEKMILIKWLWLSIRWLYEDKNERNKFGVVDQSQISEWTTTIKKRKKREYMTFHGICCANNWLAFDRNKIEMCEKESPWTKTK